MRLSILVIIGAFSVAVCFADTPKGSVSGQVFVATRGGDNFKLGDVEIAAYDFQLVLEYVEHRRAQARELAEGMTPVLDATRAAKEKAEVDAETARKAAWNHHDYSGNNPQVKAAEEAADKLQSLNRSARWGAIYSRSGLFYLENLHDPVATTRTDADGRFSLPLPPGKFVLAARADRRIAETEETYCWLVTVTVSAEPVSLNLANANMTSGDDPTSLVHTTTSEEESLASAGKAGVAELLKFKDEESTKKAAAEKAAQSFLESQKSRFVRQQLPELVKQSQARALARHPDLGHAGTELNKKFVADYQRIQAEHSELLDDPGWPEKLVGDVPPPIVFPNFPPPNISPTPGPTPVLTVEPAGGSWRTPHPPYPAAARASHITGTTTVSVSTDAAGNVSSVTITQSAGNAILDHFTQLYVKDNWKGPPNSSQSTTFEYRLQ